MNNKELDKQLLATYKHFGYEEQRQKLNEECLELLDEILLFEKGIGDINNMKKELADVIDLIRQIQLFYEIEDEELHVEESLKNDRTISTYKIEVQD